MAGIYISNIEIPKEHPLYITLRPDGSVHVWDSYSGGGYGTQAISVPDHGRLEDLDDVINDVRHYLCEGCSDYCGPDAKTESCDYCKGAMLIKTIERKSSIILSEDNTDFFTKGHLHLGRVEEGEG